MLLQGILFRGVMKSAIKMDVDGVENCSLVDVDQIVQWLTSTALFMTKCMVTKIKIAVHFPKKYTDELATGLLQSFHNKSQRESESRKQLNIWLLVV